MRTKVVTCVLIDQEGKLLILKRSDNVRTYKRLWGGITGYVEKDEDPYETAIREIKEETGIEEKEIRFIKKEKLIEFTDFYESKKYDWLIYPFLFKIKKKEKLKIDWEHYRYNWINPEDIQKYDTVPRLKEIISKILM